MERFRMTARTKMLLAMVIGLAIVIGGFVVSKHSEKKLAYEAPPSPLVALGSSASSTLSTTDTDGDGLADWEEVLWKTDPKNPDTDGDTTPDGAEVAEMRNPLKRGPDDALPVENTAPHDSNKKTATEKLSHDVLGAYLALKQGATSDSQHSLQSIIGKNKVVITAEQYTPSRFKQVPESDASIAEYSRDLATIVQKHFGGIEKNDLEILAEVLQKQDAALALQLKNRAAQYRLATDELLLVRVPASALSLHTDMVNTLSMLSETTRAMSVVLTDPVTALSSLEIYQQTAVLFGKELGNLNLFLETRATQSASPQ